MKKYIVLAIIITGLVLFGCSNEKAIEKTIGEFEDAVNDDNVNDLKESLSPDSEFYITQTFSDFMNYFSGFRNVNYPGLDISVDGDTADANSNATYNSGSFPVYVEFVMKKEKGFFSFLSPEWKVKEYWDDASGTLDFIWKKIQLQKMQE